MADRLMPNPVGVAQAIKRRRRPPCPIFADCRVDHLTRKGRRRG